MGTIPSRRAPEVLCFPHIILQQQLVLPHSYIFCCLGPIPGNIQDQVGQGSEQPDLVSGVPARCRGVGLDDL